MFIILVKSSVSNQTILKKCFMEMSRANQRTERNSCNFNEKSTTNGEMKQLLRRKYMIIGAMSLDISNVKSFQLKTKHNSQNHAVLCNGKSSYSLLDRF